MKLLRAIITAGLVAALWLLFAPDELGGSASYVVVTGESMEPGLHSGDLAIMRRAPAYRVGDVITYQHPELGAVIHRIVGVEGARFSVQGDNNDWVDSHMPAEREITGKLWFDIPGAGRYLNIARQPAILALISLVVGLAVMLPGRKHKHTQTQAAPGALPMLTDPRGRDILSLLAVLAAGTLLLAGLAFTRSTERQVVRELPYEHHGAFRYTADAPGGVYDGARVTAGQPIFRALVDSFDIEFDYEMESNAPLDASGVAGLRAELSAANGWKRSFELQPATSFSGPSMTLRGTLDLDELQRIIDRLEAETGVASRQYRLLIQPELTVDASVGGQHVSETFAPPLEFQMDAQQLQLVGASGDLAGALNPGAGGLATRRASEPGTLSLALIELDVATARQLSVAMLAVLALAIGALALSSLRLRGGSESDRLAALYGARLVSVRPGAATSGAAIDVDGVAAFQRLLEHHQGPIFKDGPVFFIDHEGQRFRLRALPNFSEVDDEGTPEPIAPPQAARPRQAIGQLLFQRKGRVKRA